MEIFRVLPIAHNYLVSSFGYSMIIDPSQINGSKPKFKVAINQFGYPAAAIRLNNRKWTTITIHRMVAIAFLANPLNKREVNHIDGNRQNASVDNLEWVTKTEHAIHAVSVLGHHDYNNLKILIEGRTLYEQSLITGYSITDIYKAYRRDQRQLIPATKSHREVKPPFIPGEEYCRL